MFGVESNGFQCTTRRPEDTFQTNPNQKRKFMGPDRVLYEKNNCGCPNKKPKIRKRNLPLLFTVIIAILPKCPFCILAYSSAITMCSGQQWNEHSPSVYSSISIVLALVVIFSILFNYRDFRSVLAFFLALSGGFLVAYSELISGEMMLYNYGTILLLFGALLNGSLIHFALRLFNFVKSRLFTLKSSGIN